MEFGYPATADIEALMALEGVEEMTDNNANFRTQFLNWLWSMLNRNLFASALGVWLPSTTAFNVRGGIYNYKGEVKTYTAGDDINPTDNDTTYIWLLPDNTIDSDIDGNGWPTTEHIKLAEIDVDDEGIITAVRDLRGQTFMKSSPDIVDEAVCFEGDVVCYENEMVLN